jgi:CTP-dependent riboflavin kinase
MGELLRGRLQSGNGDASHWLQLFNAAYSRKLQMPLYPGSLNLALEPTSFGSAARSMGESATFCSCHVSWWTSSGVKRSYGRLRRRLATEPDPWVVELVCDIGLRDTYHLRDADVLAVSRAR